MSRLKEFRGSSKLKRAALNVFVRMLSSKEIENLRIEFQKIDTDNSGTIELSELEEAVKNASLEITAQEIRAIMDELDYTEDKIINYSEFLAATI